LSWQHKKNEAADINIALLLFFVWLLTWLAGSFVQKYNPACTKEPRFPDK
jgi:hypothetical protein